MQPEIVNITPPAAPGIGATITLFDSTAMDGSGVSGRTPGWLRTCDGAWFELSFDSLSHISAVNGLLFQASADGANWNTFETYSVLASVAGTIVTYRPYIGCYRGFRATYTNGAAIPTTWLLDIKLVCGDHARVS